MRLVRLQERPLIRCRYYGDFDKAVENYTKEFYEEYKSDGMTMCESFPLWFIIKEELFVMGL
mgnify:FL=1